MTQDDGALCAASCSALSSCGAVLQQGSLPGRQRLDPEEMISFLQYAVTFDVERSGAHYRFWHNQTGPHFAHIFGRDVTGMYIEHTGSIETFEAVYRRLSGVVDDKQPAYGISPAPVAAHDS